MKIAMLLYNDFTGDARVHKEARDLAAAGHGVTIIATASVPDLAPRESRAGYAVERVALSARWRTSIRGSLGRVTLTRPSSLAARAIHRARHNPVRRLIAGELMRRRFRAGTGRIVDRIGPDAIHAHDLDTLDIGGVLARRLGAPLLYDSHELWRANNFILKAPIFEQMRWRRREEAFIHCAHTVVTTTESRAEKLREWYPGVEPIVVMNCQDGESTQRTRLLRDRLGLEDSRRIVIYQGLIHRDRGIFVALDALERLPDRFVFVAIGPGSDTVPLARAIQKRGLGARAFLLAPVANEALPEITASADYGLSLVQNTSLSYYLSAPNKLFEYMRAGLPIVASDFPEVRRAWAAEGEERGAGELGDLGVLVDPADPRAVADALLALESDPERRTRIGERSRALVISRYNWASQMRVLADAYERIGAEAGA